MKILACIVTYNRSKLLSRCIDHVLAQSRPPDSLLVINNGSTDDTLEMLQKRNVDVLTQANLGSAGGWYTAISYCLKNSFDAIWLMDDDGFPALDSLEYLIDHLSPGTACASSVVIQESKPSKFVFPFPYLDKSALPVIIRIPRKIPDLDRLQYLSPSGTYPFAHLFNGALISSSAIKKVGNVNRDYFLFGDDVDYFFRLRQVGQVFSVLQAHHYHPDVSARPYTTSKIFYYLRNSIILNTRYFNHPWLRSQLSLLVVLMRTARRNGVTFMLSCLIGANRIVLLKALESGYKHELGKNPHV